MYLSVAVPQAKAGWQQQQLQVEPQFLPSCLIPYLSLSFSRCVDVSVQKYHHIWKLCTANEEVIWGNSISPCRVLTDFHISCRDHNVLTVQCPTSNDISPLIEVRRELGPPWLQFVQSRRSCRVSRVFPSFQILIRMFCTFPGSRLDFSPFTVKYVYYLNALSKNAVLKACIGIVDLARFTLLKAFIIAGNPLIWTHYVSMFCQSKTNYHVRLHSNVFFFFFKIYRCIILLLFSVSFQGQQNLKAHSPEASRSRKQTAKQTDKQMKPNKTQHNTTTEETTIPQSRQ